MTVSGLIGYCGPSGPTGPGMPARTPEEEIVYLRDSLRQVNAWGTERAELYTALRRETESVRGLLRLLKRKLIQEARERAAARLAWLASRIDTDGYWVR